MEDIPATKLSIGGRALEQYQKAAFAFKADGDAWVIQWERIPDSPKTSERALLISNDFKEATKYFAKAGGWEAYKQETSQNAHKWGSVAKMLVEKEIARALRLKPS